MNKNSLLIFGVLAIVIILVGGMVFVNSNKSSESKIETLQQEKTTLVKKSGYEDCLQKIKTQDDEREKNRKSCVFEYVKGKGYSDNEECVGTDNKNEICKDTTRYNTEVSAINECNDKYKIPTDALTEIDCAKLLESK